MMEDAQEFVIESSPWTQIDGAPSSSSSSCSPSLQYLFFTLFRPFLFFIQFSLLSQDEYLSAQDSHLG